MIRVRLFGPEAAAIGTDSVQVTLQGAASCQNLLDELTRIHPDLTGRIAINHEFAQPEQIIGESDEVALIGLVSGG